MFAVLCTICRSGTAPVESGKMKHRWIALKCTHVHHYHCYDKWVGFIIKDAKDSGSQPVFTCPICRYESNQPEVFEVKLTQDMDPMLDEDAADMELLPTMTRPSKRRHVESEMIKRAAELEEENEQLRNENSKLNEELQDLKDENEQLRNENPKLIDELQDLKDENEQLRSENPNLIDELQYLKDQNDEMRKALSAISVHSSVLQQFAAKTRQVARDAYKMSKNGFKDGYEKEKSSTELESSPEPCSSSVAYNN